MKGYWKLLSIFLLAAMAMVPLLGCSGDDGAAGQAGTGTGTVTGTVTNNTTGTPLAGATVETSPSIEGVIITTNANGVYSASLPIGTYTLTFSQNNFISATATVILVDGQTETEDMALVPVGNVVINAGADQSSSAGGTVSLAATIEVLDGSTGTPACTWTQTAGAGAVISDPAACTTDVTLADAAVYKAALFTHLENLDRTMVQPINPFNLEEAGLATFEVEVTVDSNISTDEVAVAVDLPFAVNGGIRTVPLNVPVLLHGKTQGTWSWTIDSQPGTATLNEAAGQNPSFTPDAAGEYVISEAISGDSLTIYAGTWEGVMGDQAGLSSECTTCHIAGATPAGEVYDKMQIWLNSGHAEIMTQNIDDPSGHWSVSNCAQCHTVGFNEAADNNGFDEAVADEGWVAPLHGEVGTWDAMVANTSLKETVQRSNIQCENCHGPNTGTTLHANGTLMDKARVSLSGDLCGVCHGEPKRHARFQQWQQSLHADTGFAADESLGSDGYASSCALCHSANGFVAWEELAYAPNQDAAVIDIINTSIDEGAEIFAQTCAACHPVHDPGDTSGEPNNAKVRVSGSTPETKGGFIATGVGRGATCIMCHNGRSGAYNTTLYGMDFDGNIEMDDRVPHHGPQGDVLMGENAFFVSVGARGAHSFITDTCTNCHMELTPPPAELSYDLSGTNHGFKASLTICSDCHGVFDGGTLQESVGVLLDTLRTRITDAVKADINNIAGSVSGVFIDYDGASTWAAVANITNPVTSVTFGSGGSFNITLQDNTTVSDVSYSDIVVWRDIIPNGTVDAGEIRTGNTNGDGIVDSCIGDFASYTSTADAVANCVSDGGTLTNGQNIAKARWNLILMEEDGSAGIHNPYFVLDVLNASIATLQ